MPVLQAAHEGPHYRLYIMVQGSPLKIAGSHHGFPKLENSPTQHGTRVSAAAQVSSPKSPSIAQGIQALVGLPGLNLHETKRVKSRGPLTCQMIFF